MTSDLDDDELEEALRALKRDQEEEARSKGEEL
jgi:hypothetical protein